jgi:cytidine deaminase
MGISKVDLMIRLLPLAAGYARVPVSRFRVGAVVCAGEPQGNGSSLYLSANLEFVGQSLNTAIHAEQAAVLSAWHQGAGEIEAVAVSRPPCGFCRQFLQELNPGGTIEVIIAGNEEKPTIRKTLSELLPHAFGPRDLNQSHGFMAPEREIPHLKLISPSQDPLAQGALAAAAAAYAPYTRNGSGCGIETQDGRTFFGRYAESAAFSPSVSPLPAALVNLNMAISKDRFYLKRAVLVEHPTIISQRTATETLLGSIAPKVNLEYFETQSQ